MSTSTITHHPAPVAAAAAAVVAVAIGAIAFSIANDSSGSVAPTEPGQHAPAPPQHGSGHFEYSQAGGKVMTGP